MRFASTLEVGSFSRQVSEPASDSFARRVLVCIFALVRKSGAHNFHQLEKTPCGVQPKDKRVDFRYLSRQEVM